MMKTNNEPCDPALFPTRDRAEYIVAECRREDLGGVYATVSDAHTFGTDAIALAFFAAPKRSDVVCDLGSGCGILPLLFCRDGLCRHVTAVEIQADACMQIVNAVHENRLQDKLDVLHRDLRELTDRDLPLYSFDVVTMNPPYQANDTGLQSRTDASRLARHEIACRMADVMQAADKLLRFGGRLCICQRPERLADAIAEMRSHGIEPKRLRFLAHTVGKPPRLFLLEGKKGGKSGLIAEPTLYLKDNNGRYTPDALQMYGAYNHEEHLP